MLKLHLRAAVATAALIAAPAAFAATNLVANGGFEDPNIGATFFQDFSSGLPGWTVTTNDVDVVNDCCTPSGAGNALAYQGSQYLDLVGYGSTGAIEQTISTVVGKTYHFSFAYSNNPWAGNATASADYAFGGTTGSVTHFLLNDAANLDWLTVSGSFVATSASTVVSFNETVGANNAGVLLDAVSVTVPETSTWEMMVLGFAGLGYAGYCKAKSSQTALSAV